MDGTAHSSLIQIAVVFGFRHLFRTLHHFELPLISPKGAAAGSKAPAYDPAEFVEQQQLTITGANPYENSAYSPFDDVRLPP